MLRELKDCLNERIKLIRSDKLSQISNGTFSADLNRDKVIHYTFGNNTFQTKEMNNCHAYYTKRSSKYIIDTQTKSQCLEQCKNHYKRIADDKLVLACVYWWDIKIDYQIISLISLKKNIEEIKISSSNKSTKIIFSKIDKYGNISLK